MDADVLVVGAGLAGAAAARALHDVGVRVLALDKGRGPGGRLSTRRTPTGSFDHGAAALQAQTPAFSAWLAAETSAGRAAPWAGGHVGVPGMSALVAGLLDGIEVRWAVAVASLRREATGWQAIDAEGRAVGRAPSLVLAIPAPQAAALLKASALSPGTLPVGAVPALDAARYAPCWAALIHTDLDARCLRNDVEADGIVAALYREAEKPGRAATGHWVLHATEAWSEAHLEADAADVAARLRDAFLERAGIDPGAVRSVSAHRWRYARPLAVVDPHALEGSGLVFAGDVFGAADTAVQPAAERAWLSGRSAANRLIAARQPKS